MRALGSIRPVPLWILQFEGLTVRPCGVEVDGRRRGVQLFLVGAEDDSSPSVSELLEVRCHPPSAYLSTAGKWAPTN